MAVHAAETELQVKKPQSIGYVVEFARQISQQAVSFSNGEDTNTEGVVIVSRQVVERLQTKLRKVVAEDNKHSIRTTRATHVGPDPVVLDVNVSTFLQTDDATTPVAVKLFRITTTTAS
jgi:hypothetical protein